MNKKTLYDKQQAIQKIGTEIGIPFWSVSRLIYGSGRRSMRIFGDDLSFGGDGDYCSLKEARTAIQWYVEQLGGAVKWKGHKDET